MTFGCNGDYDQFEQDLKSSIKGGIYNNQVCEEVWGGLTNIMWTHPEHGTVGYTFRTAGGLIAGLRGEGGYMDWYCSGYPGLVPDYMLKGLGEYGWSTKEYEVQGVTPQELLKMFGVKDD